MAPWTFDIKFPCGTQFKFGSLTLAAGDDGNLRMLSPGPAPEHLAPEYGQTPCFLADSSTTSGACSGLDPYAGQHIRIVKLVWGIPIVMSMLQPSTGASSSSSSPATPDQNSANDYPEIRKVPVGTPPKRVTSSLWWPWLEGIRRIVPADIPPLED
jgi:hypothetical protein